MRVFISHSSVDDPMAIALDEALRNAPGLGPTAERVESWLDKHDIRAGSDYAEDIVDGLVDSRAAIFLLTDAALASQEVRREWIQAKSHGLVLIPFMLDLTALRRLPKAWQLDLTNVQARPWVTAAWSAAEVYAKLELPAGDCPCGSGRPYERCHARVRLEPLPSRVKLAELAGARTQGVPIGVSADGSILTFEPEDRHLLCLGGNQQGKTTLLRTWLTSGHERVPYSHRALISPDGEGLPPQTLQVDAFASDPRTFGGLFARIRESLDEGRPVMLAIDDLQEVPQDHLSPLLGLLDEPLLSIAATQHLEPFAVGGIEGSVAEALASRAMRIQLDAQAREFGHPSRSPSGPGRATVWSARWSGPRAAQIATL